MKNISIKMKITVWFALSMLVIVGLTLGSVIMISGSVVKKETFEELREVVEENSDEIEFLDEYNKLDMDDDYDLYLEYKNGYLEIDDDFIRSVNGIVCSLYDEKGNILYGENILYKTDGAFSFGEGEVKTEKDKNGNKHYYFDKKIVLKNGEILWLRGCIDADYGSSRINSIINLSLWIIPVLVLISLFGGYLVARKALKPIEKISESAESIHEGNDLTKRISLSDTSSEVKSLSDSFNRMLDRLEASFKSEQQLTGDVSHELRTPVSVIMSQCEFSLEKDREGEDYRDALKLILRQSRKMSSMINDMLSFSRLERREKDESFSDINMSEIISGVCEDMALIQDRNIILHSDIQSSIFINGDIELISRLAVNLISNAYRYGKENGNINVSLSYASGMAKFAVRDDGIGIKDEDKDKIWDRFFRADKSRSEKGTGLGLSFVKEIARLHSGKLSVESIFGEGSTFMFEVPAVHRENITE